MLNFYSISNAKTGKTAIRFSNNAKYEQAERYLYEVKHVPFYFVLKEAEAEEQEQFTFKTVKLETVCSILFEMDRKNGLTEAVKRAETARTEAKEAEEQEQAVKWYDTLSSYIMEAKTAEELYTPIHKNLYALCKTFYSSSHSFKRNATTVTKDGKEATAIKYSCSEDTAYNRYYLDILKLSTGGKLVRTEQYDSYVNTVYVYLSAMHKFEQLVNCSFTDDYCCYSFTEALHRATNKGIYSNYHSLHGGRKNGSLAEAVTYDGMETAEQERLINYHERYNTELTAMKRLTAESALEAMTEAQQKAVKLSACGFSYEHIGLIMGRTAEAVKQLVKFGRNRAILADVQTEAKKPLTVRLAEAMPEQKQAVNVHQTGKLDSYYAMANRLTWDGLNSLTAEA